VDAYFKELETLLLKVNMDKSEEAMIARFVSGLRRDIQDFVELQEYSSLGSLVHLAMKVESQIVKKNVFKNSPNDGYYNNSWKNKKPFPNLPSKDSSFNPKESMLNQVVFNVLKNPNPLKDDEASALLDAVVLVLVLFWGSSML